MKRSLCSSDPSLDPINLFLVELVDNFQENEHMSASELHLHDVDQKYLHFILQYFYLKDQKLKDKFL